jgi:tetratricopeptide (TPR) repeat protein
MQYPGNQALPAEIQERILSTFRQTVDAARQGNFREAQLGCDFVLKLDPDFSPAQQLQERLANKAAPPEAAPPPNSAAVGREISTLVGQRRFEDALALASRHRELIDAEPSLQRVLAEAQSRFEAAPLVTKLAGSAREALQEGRLGEVSALLEKVRSLDSSHPELEELGSRLAAARSDSQAAAAAIASPPPPPPPSPFSLDLDEPVANFTMEGAGPSLEGAPVAASLDPLALLEETNPAVSAKAEDVAPAPSEAAIAQPAKKTFNEAVDEAIENPFAALDAGLESVAPVASPVEDQQVPEDDLLAAFSDLPPDSTTESSAEDDPFAIFAESTGKAEAGPASRPGALATDKEELPEAELEIGETPFASLGAEPAGTSGDDRIQDLLSEGQAAFDQGDHQGAIDVWSRIFLIDIDHQEASQRIDRARQLKAESERQAEEVFQEGLKAWQAGDREKAQEQFERVRTLQPENALAQDYLARLDRGEAPDTADFDALGLAGTGSGLGGAPGKTASGAELLEEILIPPGPGETIASSPPARPVEKSLVATRRSGFGGKFLLIGAAVLLAVGAAGYYLFTHRDAFFPNTGQEKPTTQTTNPAAPGPLEQAEKLHAAGKTKLAIAQLKRMPKNNPSYEEAQALITEWEKPASTAPEPDIPPTEEDETGQERQGLLAEAREAASRGEFLLARRRLKAAEALEPLAENEAALLAQADEALLPLKAELNAMADRDWEFALSSLWAKYRQAPGSPDIILLIVDCYYNQAIRDLQKGDQKSAAANFQEAINLAPDDEEARRHLQFARAYADGEQDLLYRIYVKYLPYR